MEIVEITDLGSLERSPDLLGDHLDRLQRGDVKQCELELPEVALRLHRNQGDRQRRPLAQAHLQVEAARGVPGVAIQNLAAE